MNHNDVTTKEVADRLRAIGTLGERVAERRVDPEDAWRTAQDLLMHAWTHLEH